MHEGSALVEIYQNCPVFNDGAFGALTEKDVKDAQPDPARGRRADPLRRRAERGVAIGQPTGSCGSSTSRRSARTRCSSTIRSGRTPVSRSRSRDLAEDPTGPTPIGIFRDVERPVYGRGERFSTTAGSEEDLGELLVAGETWTVG